MMASRGPALAFLLLLLAGALGGSDAAQGALRKPAVLEPLYGSSVASVGEDWGESIPMHDVASGAPRALGELQRSRARRFNREGRGDLAPLGLNSGLPKNLSLWEGYWHLKMETERKEAEFKKPLPSALRIVLGVFSVLDQGSVRTTIRDTWMKQEGVCALQNDAEPPKGCIVNVVFVAGSTNSSSGPTPPPAHQGDLLKFGFKENMNFGKSFEWFRHASRIFPWATHVGKMDTDFFPHLHKVTESIAKADLATNPLQYLGRPMFTHNCQWPMAEIEAGGENVTKAGGSYCVSGAMYFLSRALAEDLSQDGGVWASHPDGAEDRVTGKAVSEYVRASHHHVQTLGHSTGQTNRNQMKAVTKEWFWDHRASPNGPQMPHWA